MRALPSLQRGGTCLQRVLHKASLYSHKYTRRCAKVWARPALLAWGLCFCWILFFPGRKGPARS